MSRILPFLIVTSLLPLIRGHGNHAQAPMSVEDADWATRHMAEEHHIANLDPSAFFTLHDYDSNGFWSREEVRRTYGLDDESAKDVGADKKEDIVHIVVELFDKNGDSAISREEWMTGWQNEGKRLPDFGVSISKAAGCCSADEMVTDWTGAPWG